MGRRSVVKIIVVGDGLLFDEFKSLNFQTVENIKYESDLSCLDWADVIINTYDRCYENATSDQMSAMYTFNAAIPKRISDYCKETQKRFIHVSTSKVYGNKSTPALEDDTIHPKTPYEVTKLLGEQYCNTNTIIVRPANMFNGSLHEQNSIIKLHKNPSKIDIPVSFTHTLDVIRSITALLKARETGIFNVASDGAIAPYSISPAPEYLKKTAIPDLCLTQNCVNILDTKKLSVFFKPENTIEKILECYDEILNANDNV